MNLVATLARLEEEHAEELANLERCAEEFGDFVNSADEVNDSSSPVYDDAFIEGGSEAIASLTNFSDAEFHAVWAIVEGTVTARWATGRGKKNKVKAKDAFMMALCVLKHYSHWDKHALDFNLKTSTFEKMIMKMFSIIEHPLCDLLIQPVTMAKQRAKGNLFTNYPYALYATNVKFQPSHRPSGRFQEQKRYFSGKHKLYGLKIEASVAYPGYCVDLSMHHPGSTSDFTIFSGRQDVHREMLAKTDAEQLREDNGEGSDNYQNMWALLTDKGYQGATRIMRAIQPKKKPIGAELSRDEVQRNVRVSSDRVLVENYFGRVCSLWKISRSTFVWGHESYDMLSRITFALTNFHVSLMPLRAHDGDFYRSALAKYYSQGEEQIIKRAVNQATYRRKRAARMRAERLGHERASSRATSRIIARGRREDASTPY